MAEPSHWVHDLSPFALQFSERVGIRWYGLAYLAGIAWGWWMFLRWHRQGRHPLDAGRLQDFVLYAGIGMIAGGRIGYCLFYGWHHLLADPLYVIKLWEGGMASHGGIIGLVAGCALYARKAGVSLFVLTDLISAVAPMGVLLGRIANFINGELWGKPSTVPWAVIFPHAGDRPPVPRHPSQLYEAALEGALLLAIIVWVHARHRRPGATTGVMLASYAVARIAAECFREADVGHPPYFGWMNKGQALSLPVLVIGIAVAVWAWRRGSRPDAYRLAEPPVATSG